MIDRSAAAQHVLPLLLALCMVHMLVGGVCAASQRAPRVKPNIIMLCTHADAHNLDGPSIDSARFTAVPVGAGGQFLHYLSVTQAQARLSSPARWVACCCVFQLSMTLGMVIWASPVTPLPTHLALTASHTAARSSPRGTPDAVSCQIQCSGSACAVRILPVRDRLPMAVCLA